jgi:hypothetical protein
MVGVLGGWDRRNPKRLNSEAKLRQMLLCRPALAELRIDHDERA